MEKQKTRTTLPNIKTKQDFQYHLLNHMELYLERNLSNKLLGNYYHVYSLIGKDDQDRKRFTSIFKKMQQTNDFNPQKLGLNKYQSRAIGSFMGMAICDALGSCTQFLDYKKNGYNLIKDGFKDIQKAIQNIELRSRHGEYDVWTDDASMGIAISFSLMLNKYKFDPIHIRYMFMLWLCQGLGNGGRKNSIGLGGNIKISMDEFYYNQTQFASQGKKVKNFNNGNGSLMRLAPIPVAFHDNKQKAMEYSALSSKTTHNGYQAKQCCRFLAAIIVEMINRNYIQNEKMQVEGNKEKPPVQSWKKLFEKVCNQFKSQEEDIKKKGFNYGSKGKSVQFLAKSLQQTQQIYQASKNEFESFKNFNPSIKERNWNWKQKQFTYSQFRNNQMPGYIGSYCMDGLAMALHTIWHTTSFKQCALMNANMGGDCDTVGSIAGQMAGAIYGIDQQMLKLYSEMKDFKQERFEVFLLGYKLMHKKPQSVVKQYELLQQEGSNNNKRSSSQQQRDKQKHFQQDDINKRVKKSK